MATLCEALLAALIAAGGTGSCVPVPAATPMVSSALPAAPMRKIAFVRADAGINHIYSMSEDGSAVVQLTNMSSPDNNPTVCQSTGQIAFWRQTNVGAQVWKMNADGSGQVKLSSPTPPTFDTFPSWSRDCSTILYQYQTSIAANPSNPGPMQTQIRAMSADGANMRIVYPRADDGFYYIEPHYSPDGSKIAFISNRDGIAGSNQLYLLDVAGGGVTPLTSNVGGTVSGDPFWLANGLKVGFSHRDNAGNVNIWAISPDGTGLAPMTNFTEPQEAGDGRFSFDGQRLTFELCQPNGTNRCSGQSNPNAQAYVYTQNLDGSGLFNTKQLCAAVGCAPRPLP